MSDKEKEVVAAKPAGLMTVEEATEKKAKWERFQDEILKDGKLNAEELKDIAKYGVTFTFGNEHIEYDHPKDLKHILIQIIYHEKRRYEHFIEANTDRAGLSS